VVMTMKRKLGMQRNSEKPHGNFQVPIWNDIEKKLENC
jgi:hypothetical protein